MKAVFNGETIAESDDCVMVEGNAYFPPGSVRLELLAKNGEQYTCPWKGVCDYYDVTVNGQVAQGAAFMYPEPKDAAKNITGRFAFWKEVTVTS